jgi:hypothetical protein
MKFRPTFDSALRASGSRADHRKVSCLRRLAVLPSTGLLDGLSLDLRSNCIVADEDEDDDEEEEEGAGCAR